MYLHQTPITKWIKLPVILENSKIFKICAKKENTHLFLHVSFYLKKKYYHLMGVNTEYMYNCSRDVFELVSKSNE